MLLLAQATVGIRQPVRITPLRPFPNSDFSKPDFWPFTGSSVATLYQKEGTIPYPQPDWKNYLKIFSNKPMKKFFEQRQMLPKKAPIFSQNVGLAS
jgi:hypothetical protein